PRTRTSSSCSATAATGPTPTRSRRPRPACASGSTSRWRGAWAARRRPTRPHGSTAPSASRATPTPTDATNPATPPRSGLGMVEKALVAERDPNPLRGDPSSAGDGAVGPGHQLRDELVPAGEDAALTAVAGRLTVDPLGVGPRRLDELGVREGGG